MKFTRCLLWLGAAAIAPAAPATAWGWQGHEYVGALGGKLLNPNARQHVSRLLGRNLSLPLAAVWPDCAKNASGPPGYALSQAYLAQVCNQLPTAERQGMWEYTRRNWNNCEYSHRLSNCHKAFHFADVNVHEHDDYGEAYFGAPNYDVVHAIRALMVILRCPDGATCDTRPFPGNIASKREALILLAHFVGDLHQPLHVGAIYLDPATAQETGDTGQETIGGNALLLAPGSSDNLHHEWDTVSPTSPSAQAIAQGCQIAPLPNPRPEPIESWASESVTLAKLAYNGMTFSPDSQQGNWDIQFADRPGYMSSLRRIQNQQLIKGGARLAILLNSVWPSTRKAVACR